MEIRQLHDWNLNPSEARQLQVSLANSVSKENITTNYSLIAGCDLHVSPTRDTARAAVVVLDHPGFNIVEIQVAEGIMKLPYIPGLLSFRELPFVLEAMNKLSHTPDLVLVDGQGIAHPRRLGIASHLGLFLNVPTIGCAKSQLCGWHKPLTDRQPGSWTELIDKGETIGAVLVTKLNTSPLYISIGHMIDLHSAIQWTLACCNGYRLAEPCRLAHIVAGGNPVPAKYKTPSVTKIEKQAFQISGES